MDSLHKIQNQEVRDFYHNLIGQQYKLAYQIQGIKTFEATPRCAAIHESGHIIAYQATADLVRWWPPYRAKIFKCPDMADLGLTTWAGTTSVSPKAPFVSVSHGDEEGNIVEAIRCVSGVISEMIFDGKDFRLASSADELVMFGGLVKNLTASSWNCDPEPVFFGLYNAVVSLLRTHERQLLSVATNLERSRNIGPGELRRLLLGVSRYDWRSLRRLKP